MATTTITARMPSPDRPRRRSPKARAPRAAERAAILAAATLLLAVGCRSWEETKQRYVNDVNFLLHRHFAAMHAEGSLDSILSLYAPELARDPALIERKSTHLEEFATIARSHSAIRALAVEDGGGAVHAVMVLETHGAGPDGRTRSRFDTFSVRCSDAGGRWQVTEEEPLSSRSVDTVPVVYSERARERGLINLQEMGGVADARGVSQVFPAGSGLAVGDFDGDDFDDVYFTNGDGCRLFRNRGDGTFSDVTATTGTGAKTPGKSRCALVADFDNDGRADIFVGKLDGAHVLYRQTQRGVFRDVSAGAGLEPSLETSGACTADFDGDGRLDIYVANCGVLTRMTPEPMHNALNAAPNTLFLQNVDGTFREAAAEAGVAHTGFALACTASDFDGDGDADLFVANDFGFDVLYRNRGDGTFEDITEAAGLRKRGASMSAAWGDVDGDGLPELFIGAMDSNSKWMADQPGYPAPAPWPISTLFRRQVVDIVKEAMGGNDFYRNRGDGTFELAYAETRHTGWSWSSHFLDYDNDALLDIYLLNGFVSGRDRHDL